MTTDLQLSTPQQRFLPSPTEAERVWKLAQTIAGTDFVPRGLRGNVAAITAAMLTGREIGIGPMHSLRAIDVIDGKPSLSAELMASLVLRAGHWLWVVESTNDVCTMAGRRSDWPDRIPDQTVTWTVDDAKQAGLAGKGNWQKYPRAMLRARATSELCRSVFADVVERVGYVAEELGGEPEPHVEAMATVREVAPEQADEVDAEYADEDGSDSSDVGEGEAPTSEAQPPAPAASPAADAAGRSGEAAHPRTGAPPPVAASPDHSPEGWDAERPDVPASFDWRAVAMDAGVTPTAVLATIVQAWPSNDQAARPNRLRDVDELVAAGVGHDIVRQAIERTAGGEAA
jgi:hypothetical protein